MASKDEKFIVVGRFGAPYGVKGWMKIHSFTEPYDNLMHYLPWFADLKGELTQLDISECRKHHKGIIAHIKDCDTKEDTVMYRNVNIAIKRSALPDLENDDVYWSDLEGLDVFNIDGTHYGVVDYILPTGANDVLVVKGDTEVLIPYQRDTVIKEIDLDKQKIIVDWDNEF